MPPIKKNPVGDELGDIVTGSLRGAHDHLGQGAGGAARYQPSVAPFAALERQDSVCVRALAQLLQPGEEACLLDQRAEDQASFDLVSESEVVRMMYRPTCAPAISTSTAIRTLLPGDVDQMLRLIAAVFPGYFRPRTHEMGRYYGVFIDGELAAMAGERFAPPGFREISSICTASAHQGKGLAAQLTNHAIGNVIRDGRRPFLHVGAQNSRARGLYERLGFEATKSVEVNFYRRR